MLLGLVRDRAALAMSFLLPVAFFLIFAAIFAGASGESLRLKVALADEARSAETARLFAALVRDPALVATVPSLSALEVRERVRGGAADAGLIAPRDRPPLGDFAGLGPAPLILVSDPARPVAARILAGIVQKAYFRALPDVALGSVVRLLDQDFVELTPDQKREIDKGLADLRQEAQAADARQREPTSGFEDLFEHEAVAGRSAGLNHVAYCAGAVAILFLFFSVVHGALSLLEERDAEILDRVLAGPAGMHSVVAGKFLFLTLQGAGQVLLIFVVAWLVHGVDLPGHLVPCLLITLAASAAASSLALALTAACGTRRQAQTLANITILVLSAIGGSMVPRFFMPPLIQRLGWLTPTTWALEAYSGVFWRDQPLTSLAAPLGLLLLAAALGYALAVRLARRWETL